MENVSDFLQAALPWIVMGLLLAVFFARNAKEKENSSDNYAMEGMGYGMSLGLCLFTALGKNIGRDCALAYCSVLLSAAVSKKRGRATTKRSKDVFIALPLLLFVGMLK